MSRFGLKTVSGLLLAAGLARFAAAQTPAPTLPFSIRVQQGSNVQILSDNGAINFVADAVGLPSDATITISYLGTGTATATINSITLTGSTDFVITGQPDVTTFPPLSRTNPSFAVTLRYLPTTSNRVTGRIALSYTEGRTTGSFGLNLTGVAPEFVFTYVLQPNGNSTLLASGDTIAFPATAKDDTATAVIVVTNRGSGPGVVNGITLTGGAAFSLAGVPLPPATVDPGKDLRFMVRYNPKTLENSTGSVKIDLVGRSLTFALQGSASGAVFAYDTIQESTVTASLPGQTISLPDALVGDKGTNTLVRVRNTGNADARITRIGVQGDAFKLSEVPFLPLTLTPGASASFVVNFTPTQPGRTPGKLAVGDDVFDLTGNGLGPNLIYSYSNGGVVFTLQNNASVILPPAAVGQSSSLRFLLRNEGTAPAAINSITVVSAGSVFTLSESPNMPLNIAPGETIPYVVTFTPTSVGNATATLKVDAQTFNLSSIGNTPAPLPDYSFQGATGAQQPLQQPAIGLTLASPYPVALSGTLTLTFTPEVFSNDPAVQFASGGRTVSFTIPAGSRQAVFPNNSTQIRIQTGTAAGTITVTPSFATIESNINLTPTTPPTLNLTVAQQAPQLLNVQLASKTATGFTLLVTGFATSRSITQMDFQFTPVAGENLATTRTTLNVEPSFNAWYQSTQSQQFGSQFTVSVPFTIQGDIKDTANIGNVADTIKSVVVTITNRQGVSASRSVDLR